MTRSSASRDLARTGVVAAVYLCLLGVATGVTDWYATPDGVSVWFPPAALTFALLLLVDMRVAIPLTIAGRVGWTELVGMSAQPAGVMLASAVGVTLAYAIGAGVLRRFLSDGAPRGQAAGRDVTAFLAVAASASGLAALTSRATVALVGDVPWEQAWSALPSFWVGDAVAIVTLVPLGWALWVLSGRDEGMHAAELVAIVVVTGLASGVPLRWDVGGHAPLYLVFVPLVVAAMRRGIEGAALAVGAAALVLATSMHVVAVDLDVVAVHTFLVVSAGLGLLIGSVASSRSNLIEELENTAEQRRRAVLALERERGALDTFSRRIAHDLRGPLAVLRGLAELLADGDTPDDVRRDLAGRMERNAAAAADLVDEVLRDARGGGTASDRYTDMPALMLDVHQLFAPTLEQRSARLLYDGEVERVAVPRTPLKQIIINLVSNALTHGASDGRPPVVRVHAARVDGEAPGNGGDLVVDVSDEGPGIVEADRERIFDSGYRLHGDGEGFGLAVCRDLARDLGGDIRVEPRDPFGSRFVVQVPVFTHRIGHT